MIKYLKTSNAYSKCGDRINFNQQQKKQCSLVMNVDERRDASFLLKEGLDAFSPA